MLVDQTFQPHVTFIIFTRTGDVGWPNRTVYIKNERDGDFIMPNANSKLDLMYSWSVFSRSWVRRTFYKRESNNNESVMKMNPVEYVVKTTLLR